QKLRGQKRPEPVSRDSVESRSQIINARRIEARGRCAESSIGVFLPSWIYLTRRQSVVKRFHLIVVQEHVVSRRHAQLESGAAFGLPHKKERDYRYCR